MGSLSCFRQLFLFPSVPMPVRTSARSGPVSREGALIEAKQPPDLFRPPYTAKEEFEGPSAGMAVALRCSQIPDSERDSGQKGISVNGRERATRQDVIRRAVTCLAGAGLLLALIAQLAVSPLRVYAQTTRPAIYPEHADAKAQIHQALLTAGMESKRVIVVFGADWCPDCRALDLYFHDPGNASLLQHNFVLVHVNVGRFDKNLNVAKTYGVPLKKGIPALVVLDHTGHVLYAQKNGQFADMHELSPSTVTAFLQKWKPTPH